MFKNDKDTEELKDGESLRVPMIFMDQKTVLDDGIRGGLHRPGFRYGSESPSQRDARSAMYDNFDEELCNRYETPEPLISEPSPLLDEAFDDEGVDPREAAYQEYDKRLTDA